MTLDPLIGFTLRTSFGVLFGLAAGHKIADMRSFFTILRKYLEGGPLDGHRSITVFGGLIIALEIALTGACAFPLAPIATAGGAAGALLVYAVAMYVNLRRGRVLLDCGCSWAARRQPISGALVLRNLCLAALAALMAIPIHTRLMGTIDVLSIVAASLIVAVLYSAINGLLSIETSHPEAA